MPRRYFPSLSQAELITRAKALEEQDALGSHLTSEGHGDRNASFQTEGSIRSRLNMIYHDLALDDPGKGWHEHIQTTLTQAEFQPR